MKKPTILIVDDDRHFRSAVRVKLTSLGYRVVEASDGLGALSQHPAGCVDAVILDHEMPYGDGRSIARVIRSESDVPIVFLSGHAREDFRAIVMQLPNVYFLAKPLDDRKLADLLAALVESPQPAVGSAAH